MNINQSIIPLIIYPENHNCVSQLQPTIKGTGEPNATINGTIDNMAFATNIKDNGEWSYTLPYPLKDNTTYIITLTQIGMNGHSSSATSVEFKVDTSALIYHAVTSTINHQH